MRCTLFTPGSTDKVTAHGDVFVQKLEKLLCQKETLEEWHNSTL